MIDLIGGLLLSISFFPQMKKMWQNRTKDFEEISLTWIIITLTGGVLYLAYGFMINSLGIIILNLVANASMILMLLIYLGVWRNETN